MSFNQSELDDKVNMTVEVGIRLALVLLILLWCISILLPFIGPVVWGTIIAVSLSPLYLSLNKRLGDKPKRTSFIITALIVLLILVPSIFLVSALFSNLRELGHAMREGKLSVPPPSDSVAGWPLIGDKVYDIWNSFSTNLTAAFQKYEEQVANLGKKLLSSIMTLAVDILLVIVSFIIAGVLLATKGTRETISKFAVKLAGKRGEEYATLAESTIRSVTKGILGVAVIQGVALGIIFLLAGVPYAGLWSLISIFLGIIMLPPTLVGLPVIIYLYSVDTPTMATIWAVLILVACLSDNVLKPILLGKGAPVPMLVIFLGAIGGFLLSGLMGLFTGAIILSLGYKLFIAWLNEPGATSSSTKPVEP